MAVYDFGLRILKLRKERGLSQKDLAQKIGISNSSLGNYENDLGVPPLNVAEDLADAFNVSLDYLVSGDKAKTITVKGLTNDQVQLITELAQELVMPTSHGAKMSTKQQELLARIIENFVR